MDKKVLKQSIKNINFALITEEICDPVIIHDKFLGLYDSSKGYLIAASNIFNSLSITPETKSVREQFRDHVEIFKKELYKYRKYRDFVKTSFNLGITKDLEDELITTFKLFCKGPIIGYMMYAFRIMAGRDTTDTQWIVKTKTAICPFKDCDITINYCYHSNKTVALEYLGRMKVELDTFYKLYVYPNFNLDKSIDGMCDLIEKLHQRGEVICNLVPAYIRAVQKAKVIDIEALNLAYLESDNHNTFALGVMQSLLEVKGEAIRPCPRTTLQLKRLIAYVELKNNDPRLKSTISAGKSLLNLEDD
jgi:hypothetical protein